MDLPGGFLTIRSGPLEACRRDSEEFVLTVERSVLFYFTSQTRLHTYVPNALVHICTNA